MNYSNTATVQPRTDLESIKAKQQATWGHGDYGRVGTTIQITGESICEAMDVRAGASVLDVAGGNGNASLAAARRFCNVVCTDYVKALLDNAAYALKPSDCPSNFKWPMPKTCRLPTTVLTMLCRRLASCLHPISRVRPLN